MGWRSTDTAMAVLCAVVPACLAASQIANVPDAAHDAAVVRVLALGGQPWRALDLGIGSLLTMLPLGTRAARAALGGALVTAAVSVALYTLIRRLLAECAETRRLGPLVAAIGTALPLVGAPWQIEASSVGGSVTGALLALLPLAFAAREGSSLPSLSSPNPAAFALGLAAGYEPLVGVCAALGYVTFVSTNNLFHGTFRGALPRAGAVVPSFVLGLAPLAVALGRTRGSGVSVTTALAVAWSGERGASHAGSPFPFVRLDVGLVLVSLAVAGAALAMFVGRARPLASALAALAIGGVGAAWLGAPVGPTRFGAPVLTGLAAIAGLAAVAMQATVRAVAQAHVPLARTSASMILLLEVVMPLDRADDAVARTAHRRSSAPADWSDATWGALPPNGAVLLSDPRLYERARADEACGALRPDLALVPAYPHTAAAWRSLAQDESLVPLRRDLQLYDAPGEESLSTLAIRRPVAVAFAPQWGRPLARHLVPLSLLDRFEPEPRGASDRRRALDAVAPAFERLTHAIAGDPELVMAAGWLLRARESGIALDGDKDVLARAQADVEALDPAPRH